MSSGNTNMNSSKRQLFRESARRSLRRPGGAAAESNAAAGEAAEDPNTRYARAIERNLAKDPSLKSYLQRQQSNSSSQSSTSGASISKGKQAKKYELDDKVRKIEVEWDFLQPATGGNAVTQSSVDHNLLVDAPNLSPSSEQYSRFNAASSTANEFSGDPDFQVVRSAPKKSTSIALDSYYGNGEDEESFSGFGSRYRTQKKGFHQRYGYGTVALIAVLTIGISASVYYLNPARSSSSSSSGGVGDSDTMQREVLKEFYHAAGGDNWKERYGWLSDSEPVCEWHGIACNSGDRVTTISLPRNQLTGSITPSLGKLYDLKFLDLAENQLTSTLPGELFLNTKHLEEIYLFSNHLEGPIPDHIGDHLEHLKVLSLDSNSLTSSIPESLWKMKSLNTLDIGSNQLTGEVSSEIKYMTNLEELYLDENSFEGSIPDDIGKLTNLQYLYMHRNKLEGTIPTSMGHLTKLEEMLIYGNFLSGDMPESVCDIVKSTDDSSIGNLRKLESDCAENLTCRADCCTRCF